MTINIEYVVRSIRKFIEEFGVEAIPFKIKNIIETTEHGTRSQKDCALCGLRYSEFLAENDSDDSLIEAVELQDYLHTKLGIDFEQLMADMKKIGMN